MATSDPQIRGDETMIRLHVVIASTRPGRTGLPVADWFTGVARTHGAFDVRTVDLAEVALPFFDEPEHPSTRSYRHEHTREWSRTVDAADAFVFVMPEYNYGFNAPLKNALDFLYHEWQYKPVGFVSYGGTSAGTRAVQMIKQVVTTLRMYPLNDAVAIPTRQRLDPAGILHPDQAMTDAAAGMLDELDRLARTMRPLREAATAH
jgi:NAD(P)H-dependent FMN reductase